MCQGEEFFTSEFVPIDNFLVAEFRMVGVYPSVCLSCGFVAPTLDDVGLAIIREFAETQEDEIHGKPSGPGLAEL